jgi:hypothetical protein
MASSIPAAIVKIALAASQLVAHVQLAHSNAGQYNGLTLGCPILTGEQYIPYVRQVQIGLQK